jgi:hypothetical protein
MKPPFEIYHDGTQIADADGHICSAESPEIALEIVAALTRDANANNATVSVQSSVND